MKNSWKLPSLLLCGKLALNAMAMGQSESCPPYANSKSEKALEKGLNSAKYDLEKRLSFLQVALVDDEACYACAQELGHLLFMQFQRGARTEPEIEAVLIDLVTECPTFHAEPWYELGAIAYATGDLESAQERFQAFLDFPAESPLGKRYDRQSEEVREVMASISFELDFHAFEHEVSLLPVNGVNSAADEYLPTLSPDGSLLFLTRGEKVKPKGDVVSQWVERFQWALRMPDELDFDAPRDLAPPFNDGTHYGGASISVDNRELFIAASNPVPSNPDNIDLFVVKYEVLGPLPEGGFEYQWGPLKPLPDQINSPDGWEPQPAFAADGSELFFAAVKAESTPDPDGNPTMDLMVSKRDESGQWSLAEPLVDLNTEFNEKSPFLHPDGKTLYFSSDRIPGGGGYDIWYSRRNEAGTWEAPVNVGAPVNTAGDEHGLVVAADGFQAYLGSRRSGTKGLDILGLRLPPPHRASEVTIVRGSLLTLDGRPDTTAQVGLLNTETMERSFLEVNADDGTFARAVDAAEASDLVLFTEGPSTSFDALLVSPLQELEAPPTDEQITRSSPVLQLQAKPIESKAPYEVRDLLYATGSAEISEASHPILIAFADYLIRHPEWSVAIHGHTDDIGSRSNNQRLSEERAAAVGTFLIDAGVDSKRLTSRGFGPDRPRAKNDTEAGRAANRRTEFVITNG